MSARSSDGTHEKVYPFQDLEIGESITITGIEGNIRSSASMWGRRYGIWLTVGKVADGVCRVTRIPIPVADRRDNLEQILKHMVELLVEIKQLLQNDR